MGTRIGIAWKDRAQRSRGKIARKDRAERSRGKIARVSERREREKQMPKREGGGSIAVDVDALAAQSRRVRGPSKSVSESQETTEQHSANVCRTRISRAPLPEISVPPTDRLDRCARSPVVSGSSFRADATGLVRGADFHLAPDRSATAALDRRR
jgi:hypothetical protein